MTIARSDAAAIVHQYSEWLDGEKLVLSEEDSGDDRSHDDLVRDFLEQRDERAIPAVERS